MFFSLSTSRLDNFPYHYTLPNGLVLNTDDGWNTYTTDSHTVIIKGYANKCSLSEVIDNLIVQDIPTYKGNFCAFVADSEHVKILHDTNRGFPLWAGDECVTNLFEHGEQRWIDCIITVNNKLECSQSFFTAYKKNTQQLTDAELVDSLHNTICETYEQFLTHNTKPLKMFLSGGIDTTTVWAYLDYFTKNYELVDYEYIKFTPFYCKNSTALRKFWAYQQIHLWDDDCVLVSGSNGDENFLRGPFTLAIALKQHNLTFDDILQTSDYHYSYLMKTAPNVDDVYKEIANVEDYILNMNANDYQHWHLDRTLTFTPFKDISLLSTVLCSSKDLLIDQARNAEINKQLVRKLDASKLDVLSNNKNYLPFENIRLAVT